MKIPRDKEERKPEKRDEETTNKNNRIKVRKMDG